MKLHSRNRTEDTAPFGEGTCIINAVKTANLLPVTSSDARAIRAFNFM